MAIFICGPAVVVLVNSLGLYVSVASSTLVVREISIMPTDGTQYEQNVISSKDNI